MCGKSHDLMWLAGQHGPDGRPLEVVGVELAREAAVAFFSEQGIAPSITRRGPFEWFAHQNLAIAVGDFFLASPESLSGPFDAAYDRGALIALPAPMRPPYIAALRRLLVPGAPILLVLMSFDAEGGPPHAIDEAMARQHHAGAQLELLATDDITAAAPNVTARGAARVQELTTLVRYPAG
jgi:thiopurine S-methyltransferase